MGNFEQKVQGATKMLMISFLLFSLLFQSNDAFNTKTCDHEDIDAALVGLDNCIHYDAYDKVDDESVCDLLTPRKECETDKLGRCFETHYIEKIREERFSRMRKELLTTYKNISSSLNFILGMCQNVSYQNTTQEMLITQFNGIEYLKSDKNCTKEQISKFNTDLPECLEKQTKNAIKIFGNNTYYSDQDSKTEAQAVLDRTVRKCLLKPTCFSDRELITLSKILSKSLKVDYSIIIYDRKTGKEMRRIALGDFHAFTKVNIFSGSISFKPFSFIMFLILAVSLII